jgi:replicative DNA helicase
VTTTLDTYDTERELLGILLTYPTADGVRGCWDEGLTAEDFSRSQHRVVYATIVDRLKAGEDTESIALINHLERDTVPAERGRTVNALEYVGGRAAVLSLTDHVGVPSLVKGHAREIVLRSLAREMRDTGVAVQEQAEALAPIADVVTAAERRMAAARDRADGRATKRKSDVSDLLQRVLEHYISPEPDDLVPFSLPMLNAIGGGMAPGDVVVVGARSGVGKSWWGLEAGELAVLAHRRTADFSMEMPGEQMIRRLLAMGGLNLTGIRKRALNYDDLEQRAGVIDKWRGMFDIYDGPTSVDRMQSVLASARIDGKPYRVVVVDHVHLLRVPGSKSDYRISLNDELTRIKHLAVEHGCTVILLAQLNRPRKGFEKDRPTIHDLRESGGIGDIADYVLLLHREPGEDGYPTNQGVVIVEKVRDGAGACDIPVVFDPRNYRFRESTGFMAGMPGGREIA